MRDHYDVAILDISMPHLDGISVVRAIRRSPGLHDLPIVMFTSDSHEEVVRDLVALGISDYIVKPLNAATAAVKLAQIRAFR